MFQPIRLSTSWVSSSSGSIKINVDGSYSVECVRSGIGGVFQDHSGNVILHFSKEIILDSTILTKGFGHQGESSHSVCFRWKSSVHFFIELDSSNTVAWFKDTFKTP